MPDENRPELVALDGDGKPVPIWFIGPVTVACFAANHAEAMNARRSAAEAKPKTMLEIGAPFIPRPGEPQ